MADVHTTALQRRPQWAGACQEAGVTPSALLASRKVLRRQRCSPVGRIHDVSVVCQETGMTPSAWLASTQVSRRHSVCLLCCLETGGTAVSVRESLHLSRCSQDQDTSWQIGE